MKFLVRLFKMGGCHYFVIIVLTYPIVNRGNFNDRQLKVILKMF